MMTLVIVASVLLMFFFLRGLARPKNEQRQESRPSTVSYQPMEDGAKSQRNSRRGAPAHVLAIDYIDNDGNRTHRVIEVQSRDRGGWGYLAAYCRLRHERRTFRLDRITHCVNVETGEIIDDIYAHLHKRRL
jgi:hypothetical protein